MTIISMENNTQELILERIDEVKKRLQKLKHDASLLDVDLVPLEQSGALNFEIIGKWKPRPLEYFDDQLSEFSPDQRYCFRMLMKTEISGKGYYRIEYKAENGKFLKSGDEWRNETCTELYRRSTRTWITEFALPNGKKERIAKTVRNGMLEIVLEDENGVKMELLYKRDEEDDHKEAIMAIESRKTLDERLAFMGGAMGMLFFLLFMHFLFYLYS